MIRFTLPNSGFTIEAADEASIHVAYEHLGGSSQALSAHIRRAITAFEHGHAAATAVEHLNAQVISDEPVGEDAEPQQVDDPWESHPAARTTQNAPARRGPTQGSTQHRGDPAQFLGEDRFGSKFYRDPSAPNCDCGVQAIRKAAISQKGNRYSAYVCFDAGPPEAGCNYKSKCQFSEFVPKGRG